MTGIQNIRVSDLKQYANNPRRNGGAVDAVANSIREFGFRNPLIIDRDNVIIAGHTRLAAARKLGLREVPCIMADDLTPEQANAFRLADNKTAELAEWDPAALDDELEKILNINMADFGFDLNLGDDVEDDGDSSGDDDNGGYFGDEREKTYNAYRLNEYDETRVAGDYEFPVLRACHFAPDELVGFNYVKSAVDGHKSGEFGKGVHFFIDDYQFERVWSDPQKNIERLRNFACVLTPDFSLYLDMPMAMKIWNVYRSRLIGQMMQDAGIEVIPTLQWAEAETLKFCFDGIEPGGVVAVSTVGVMEDKDARGIWAAGMGAAIEVLRPEAVVCYGNRIDYDFGEIRVKYIEARKFGR